MIIVIIRRRKRKRLSVIKFKFTADWKLKFLDWKAANASCPYDEPR